ncbi:hypothetical protein [Streptomyces sp. NPDC005078]|uniref:hypothetical protein n=1 Tax=Streptomyces sp. NPDC005078 TaxID=3154293 RepID=UPI0033AD27B2
MVVDAVLAGEAVDLLVHAEADGWPDARMSMSFSPQSWTGMAATRGSDINTIFNEVSSAASRRGVPTGWGTRAVDEAGARFGREVCGAMP